MSYGKKISASQLHEAITTQQFDPLPEVASVTELTREVFMAATVLKRAPWDSPLVMRNTAGERLDALELSRLAEPAIAHAQEELGIPFKLPETT